MKKIVVLSLILIVTICIMSNVYATISCNVSMQTAKTEFKPDEEFVVDFKLSNIQSEKGVIAFGATLEYDKSSLTVVKMEGKNGWATPSYSEANGKIVMERNGFATKDETMFQVTFKVKEQNNKNVSISLKNIEVADGNERSKIGDANKNITIKKENQNTEPEGNTNSTENIIPNPNTNVSLNSTTGKNVTLKDNSISSTKIPKAGESNVILMGCVIFIILISIVFYIKIKLMDK